MKNYAVVANRYDSETSNDNFPTPPWATRALLEHLFNPEILKDKNCLEPACGQGHMSKVLKEYFGDVISSDIHSYGYGEVKDFLSIYPTNKSYDYIITNPPFNKAEEFIYKSLLLAHDGVAMLVRTSFIESVGRYERLFSKNNPTHMLQFSERVPMFKGRLSKTGSTATSYCWLVWLKNSTNNDTILDWISPCRKKLEKDTDYIELVV